MQQCMYSEHLASNRIQPLHHVVMINAFAFTELPKHLFLISLRSSSGHIQGFPHYGMMLCIATDDLLLVPPAP